MNNVNQETLVIAENGLATFSDLIFIAKPGSKRVAFIINSPTISTNPLVLKLNSAST